MGAGTRRRRLPGKAIPGFLLRRELPPPHFVGGFVPGHLYVQAIRLRVPLAAADDPANSLVHPQEEHYWGNVNTIGIRSCYDEGKRCAETLCFDYHRQAGTQIKVIRIFNTYGPAMDPNDGRVVSNFIMQALRGEDITIYGDGSQTRSFQYIDDLLNGIDRMMNESRPDFSGPVNLGNPHEFSMLELAEKVLSKIGGKSKIVFKPLPSDDPTRRRPDITLAKKELNNWEPSIQLDEGLERTIEYFRTLI